MLIDPNDVANPCLLVLGDHGRLSSPSWSPDGKYIVYTLYANGKSDLWWLDVASGATRPITQDGQSLQAHWRPTNISSVYLPLVMH